MEVVMKKVLNKALIFFSCLTLLSCHSRAVVTNISILYDITDPLLRKPLLVDILTISNIDENIWQGLSVHIETICDMTTSDQWDFILPEENHLQVSRRFRLLTVANFKEKIMNRLTYLDSINNHTSLKHSIIYEPIVKVSNKLSKIYGQFNYLLVYSNLMENSVVNFHNAKEFEVLKTQPIKIKQILIKEAKLKDLEGLKIYLLFKANSYEESNCYKIASHFFTSLLTEKSASVQLELPVK